MFSSSVGEDGMMPTAAHQTPVDRKPSALGKEPLPRDGGCGRVRGAFAASVVGAQMYCTSVLLSDSLDSATFCPASRKRDSVCLPPVIVNGPLFRTTSSAPAD